MTRASVRGGEDGAVAHGIQSHDELGYRASRPLSFGFKV